MARDPELLTHLEWLGYLQPVGLVVSPPALVAAQAFPAKNIIPDHSRFVDFVEKVTVQGEEEPQPAIRDFPRFATEILGWEPSDVLGSPGVDQVPDSLEVALTQYNETLRPSYAVPEFNKDPSAERRWLMLIQRVNLAVDLDKAPGADAKDHRWQASPQARFERLLRETQVPIGILSNGTHLRLVYAPRGESSGHLTFPVRAMTEVAGRPIFAALHMLLDGPRVFNMPDKQRLAAILAESRKHQNLVSTRLAEQVLAALYELLRGFQAADDQRHGNLLRDVLKDDPNLVYGGLLRVLMRMVFLLYAEDRSLLSTNEVYQKHYSLIGLFERLRKDAGRHSDTMDHRFGTWAQLLTLFRLVYDGGRHGRFRLLARKGYLFDPDQYPFLEGRAPGSKWKVVTQDEQTGTETISIPRIEAPRVSDHVVYRVLQNLLVLDGERLSYRTLDVEQIGSVYETMMGFNLEVAAGRSIAIKATKPHGAPATINLDELLAVKPADRAKWLKEKSDQALTGQAATALREARTLEDIVAALERKVAREATPNIVPPGAMVLQPSDERRRSGSHYTPRSLTEPIVRTTLRPVLERLGPNATPEQILDLKVCDPAMGSGAFLVEGCRHLAEALVKAWRSHNRVPETPNDEEEILHARRIVAQRCLYGVDKNPMAVDLAKLSLWLVTLASEHPFTFLDHALRCGDSLVGLSRKQLMSMNWTLSETLPFVSTQIINLLLEAEVVRLQIQKGAESLTYEELEEKLDEAQAFQADSKLLCDVTIDAFFSSAKPKERSSKLKEYHAVAQGWLTGPVDRGQLEAVQRRNTDRGLVPFHWEIEFPEVFVRPNRGFDAVVGNPPFMGGSKVSGSLGPEYLDWLKTIHGESHGNADLVAHFFRRAFSLLRERGTLGLVATNTIGQGDTRSTGLRWICTHGGVIFAATRRKKWPGHAAVMVSIVHIGRCSSEPGSNPIESGWSRSRRGEDNGTSRGPSVEPTPRTIAFNPPYDLDGIAVPIITAYLFRTGGDEDPKRLSANFSLCFNGCKIYGQGFAFDDTDESANSVDEIRRLISSNPRNAERIFQFIGGEEINENPTHSTSRYVINFCEMTEDEAGQWPDLLAIVRRKVKPERLRLRDTSDGIRLKQHWWLFGRSRPELQKAKVGLDRFLACSMISKYLGFCFLRSTVVPSHNVAVVLFQFQAAFAVLQSRCHDLWSGMLSSGLEDRQGYRPSDCFETFPFSPEFESNCALESAGQTYYDFRAALMTRNNEGLTKTYNRFHDPDERSPDILKLRELHAAMDRAVLDAYGWTDLILQR
jgi:hypothetical protein